MCFALCLNACFVGGLLGCNSSDVGQSCPQLLATTQALFATDDTTTTSSQNVVGTGQAYAACSDLTCVAAGGREGMCSSSCLDDGGCPDGFACEVVQNIGVFAGQTFCVWKTCTTRDECGPGKAFCCTQLVGAAQVSDFKQCAFSTDGRCP